MPESNKEVSKIAKKGVETVQEIVTEFILFVTSEACELAATDNRSTIQSVDILKALERLGFDSYHYYCVWYNEKYNEIAKKRKNTEDQQQP